MGRNTTNQHIDMLGFRSGKLLVIKRTIGDISKRAYWQCRCDCGNTKIVMGKYLRSNEVKSCGCLNRTSLTPRTTHGLTVAGVKRPRAYNTWSSMKDRCSNPNNPKWAIYGGRGIKVCERWKRFENFYADMGDPPDGMSIDRENVNKDYCLSNCRWATPIEQSNNTRTNRWIAHAGQKRTLTGWAKHFGISPSTLHGRAFRMGTQHALEHYLPTTP